MQMVVIIYYNILGICICMIHGKREDVGGGSIKIIHTLN